jgi:hypothetical protein
MEMGGPCPGPVLFKGLRGSLLKRRQTMKLKALDTIAVTSVKPENILRGETFDVDADVGKSLIARGLAVSVGEKATAPSKNKAAKPARNKAAK